MLIGIQGSGKTTYSKILSKKEGIPIVSTDGIRDEDPTLEGMDVFTLAFDRVAGYLKEGKSVIYDATNVTPLVRGRFFTGLQERGIEKGSYEVVAHYFTPNLELSLARVIKRNNIPGERFLPLDIVESYSKNIIKPTLEEGFSEIVTIDNYMVY